MRRTTNSFLALALSGALSACNSLHLYNKSADELATSAKASYADGKVLDALMVERGNLDALQRRELESYGKVLTVRRDLDLLSLVVDAPMPFAERTTALIDNRLAELSGLSPFDANKLLDLRKPVLAAREAVSRAAGSEAVSRKNLLGIYDELAKLPTCNEEHEASFKAPSLETARTLIGAPKFTPPGDPAVFDNVFAGYARTCVALIEAERALPQTVKSKFQNGQLAEALTDANKRAQDLALAQERTKAASAALRKASEEEAAARKQKDAAAHQFDLTCKDDADKRAQPNEICRAIGELKKLGNLGVKALSEEQIQNIDLTLAALSGTATPDEEAKLPAGIALLSTSVRMADVFHQYRTADKLPALEPLIIEKQLVSAKLKVATQMVELEKLRVALAWEKFEALWLEQVLLLQARAQLGAFAAHAAGCSAKSPPARCLNVSGILSDKRPTKNGEPAARVAFRALTLVSESYSLARSRAESAELQLVLADYRESLIASEGGVAAWDAPVATPLTQIQTYHSGGVKTEDFARLLQALGVVGIAARID